MTLDRLRLDDVKTLLVDGDRAGAGVMLEMMRGLGFTSLKLAHDAQEAFSLMEITQFDLCLCDAQLPDMTGPDFARTIRALPAPTRYLPLLMLTGYAAEKLVTALRDAGAHMVMAKPASPQSLYDRLAWVAEPKRGFVEGPTYTGPDRRFRSLGPPGGVGRRSTDLSIEIGVATQPNMSQDEIDSLIKPMRVMAE